MTCLITGATSGIGKATALAIARRGIHTVIVGRNHEKCLRTALHIKQKSRSEAVDFFIADLASLSDVRKVAAAFKEKYSKLDILVNNVGARFMNYIQSPDGYEMTFALNHLSGFLLTHLLMDTLNKCKVSRIVNVASGAHARALELESLLVNVENYDGRKAYAQSKLANLLFTYELSRRVAGTGITVNAVDPGGVATNFNRNNGFRFWLRHIGAHILARNLTGPQKGAETSVYLAISQDVEGITGRYYRYRQPIESSPASYDRKAAKRIWELSEKFTGMSST